MIGISFAPEKEGVNRSLGLLALAGALVMPAVYSLTRPDPQEKAVLTLMSDPYRLDKIYRSMEGPWSIQRGIHLGMVEESRVQWVTGLETEVLDATGRKPISQEFFCHSNLTFAERSGSPANTIKRWAGRRTSTGDFLPSFQGDFPLIFRQASVFLSLPMRLSIT